MTNKTKNIVLVIGFVFLLVLCYKLAFKKTLVLKKELYTLKQEEQLFKQTPKQISILSQKQKYYDSLLNKYQINDGSIQNNLLKTITELADKNNLKIVSFLEPHIIINDDGLTIKSYQFIVEGNYNEILKLVYHLEQETKFGEITNLHFEKKKNFRTGKYYIQTHLLIKSFVDESELSSKSIF